MSIQGCLPKHLQAFKTRQWVSVSLALVIALTRLFLGVGVLADQHGEYCMSLEYGTWQLYLLTTLLPLAWLALLCAHLCGDTMLFCRHVSFVMKCCYTLETTPGYTLFVMWVSFFGALTVLSNIFGWLLLVRLHRLGLYECDRSFWGVFLFSLLLDVAMMISSILCAVVIRKHSLNLDLVELANDDNDNSPTDSREVVEDLELGDRKSVV